MLSFQQYKTQTQFEQVIIEMTLIHAMDGVIFESMFTRDGLLSEGKIKDFLTQPITKELVGKSLGIVGLHAHGSGQGLIQQLIKTGKGVAQLFMAGIRGDKGAVKEIAGRVSKADVMQFLTNLDMVTLHAITGPIHIIDAVTGWHIGANLKKATSSIVDQIKKAFSEVKTKLSQYVDKSKMRGLHASLTALEKTVVPI